MRKILLIIASIVFVSTKLLAQDTLNGKCWTPEMDTTEFQNQPWFSNNDYLERFLDSIGYPPAGSGNRIIGAPVRFWIPIKFWIYRDDNGVGGPTLSQIQNLMDNLNRRFNQTNNAMIGFYMKCDPTYIDNSNNLTKTFTGASILMATNRELGSFNVHIIESFAASGVAGFSIPPLNASMIPSGSYLQGRANGDLAHEIGHLLGLAHTHQYSTWNWKCFTESVSRTRTWPTFNFCPTRVISNRVCEATGDGLRDTQADDNLIDNNSCFYNVAFGSDEWGDSYDNPPAGLQDRPNVRNIMSYNSATDCVDQFSRLQIAVMLRTLKWRKTDYNYWNDVRYIFDSYEPDNSSEIARPIVLSEVQEHNFHQQYENNGGIPNTTQCDVDWVRFIPTCNMSYDVQTSAITGRTNANTRLTIFDANLTQLAQNDDISSSNQFSEIIINLTAGQTYFFKIENMSANVTGYYSLKVSPSFTISGDNNFCTTSNNYTINSLPAGAIINWQATPSGIITINSPNFAQTTLTKNANGIITLTATITNACGGTPITISKSNILVGVPQPPLITNLNYDSDCGTFMEAYCSNPATASGFIWNLNFGQVIQNTDGYGSDYIYVSPLINSPQDGLSYNNYISVQAKNTCGTSDPSATRQFTVGPVPSSCGGGGGILKLSPNPTASTLTLETANNRSFTKIRIIDKMGNVKKEFRYPAYTKKATLNIAELPSDIYRIQAFDGKQWMTTTFLKQ